MDRLLLATSRDNGIVDRDGELLSRGVERPDSPVRASDRSLFLQSARIKWGMLRVVGPDDADGPLAPDAAPFPLTLKRLPSGERVFVLTAPATFERDVSQEARGEHGRWTATGSAADAGVAEAAEDYAKNGVRAAAFKRFFGDWEHAASTASKVVNADGTPQKNAAVDHSIVVNEAGQPVPVYHGTAHGGFLAFDPKRVNDNDFFGPGFYFTESKAMAGTYTDKDADKNAGDGTPPEIKSVYLNIRQPFDGDTGRITLAELPEPQRSTAMATAAEMIASQADVPESLRVNIPDKDGRVDYRSLAVLLGGGIASADKRAATDVLRKLGFDGITHLGGLNVGRPRRGIGRSLLHQTKIHRVWVAFDPPQIKSVDNRGTFDPTTDRIDMTGLADDVDAGFFDDEFEGKHQRDAHGRFSPKDGGKLPPLSECPLPPEPKTRDDAAAWIVDAKKNPYVREAERRLAADTSQTIDKYMQPDGTWDAARVRDVHQPIIARFLNAKAVVPPDATPRLVMLIGPFGAGKSTVGAPYVAKLMPEYTLVNPDEAKRLMPEDKGYNATSIHEESSYLSKKIQAAALEQHHNILFDGSGQNGAKMVKMAEAYAARGYEVHVVHVTVPPQVSVYRAAKRFLGNPFGVNEKKPPSRYAPLDYVFRDVDSKPDVTYTMLKGSPAVRSGVSLDNNVPLGTAPNKRDEFVR